MQPACRPTPGHHHSPQSTVWAMEQVVSSLSLSCHGPARESNARGRLARAEPHDGARGRAGRERRHRAGNVRRAPAPGAWDDYSHVDTPARTATPVGDATRAPLARPQATRGARGALHRTCRNDNVSPGGRDFFFFNWSGTPRFDPPGRRQLRYEYTIRFRARATAPKRDGA